MKPLLLFVAVVATVASSAFAVQFGEVRPAAAQVQHQAVAATIPTAPAVNRTAAPAADLSGNVPEPGTMALASMGLLALGAAFGRRRGR